eukprot:512621_1
MASVTMLWLLMKIAFAYNNNIHRKHIAVEVAQSLPFNFKYSPLSAPPMANPEIYITTFGGDPTGVTDSTQSFQNALNEAMSRGIKNDVLDGSIQNCGGATVNLQGGVYLISEPLWTTAQRGNFRIIEGTIKASDSFQTKPNTTSFLLSIWGPTQDIGLENLFFDCNSKCDGGLLIDNSVGAVVGPQTFFLGFNEVGVRVNGGHEVMIYNTWIGQYVWNDKRRINASATGIELDGNDHFVNDVIIWSGKIGLVNKGGANIIYGLHTYNLATEYGGIGIINYADSARIIGCYLDYNDLVLVSPINLVSVQDTFFLGGTTIRLQANDVNSSIQSLSIRDCQYSIGGYTGVPYTVVLDETNGKFMSIKDVHIGDVNIGGYNIGGYKIKTTKYTKKLSLKNSTKWSFDFSDVLLFDTNVIPIEYVDYTFQFDSSGSNDIFDYKHALLKSNQYKITVQCNIACDATVYVTVDQSKYT